MEDLTTEMRFIFEIWRYLRDKTQDELRAIKSDVELLDNEFSREWYSGIINLFLSSETIIV